MIIEVLSAVIIGRWLYITTTDEKLVFPTGMLGNSRIETSFGYIESTTINRLVIPSIEMKLKKKYR